jgi:zinc/manganese transport system substrate-binding protein
MSLAAALGGFARAATLQVVAAENFYGGVVHEIADGGVRVTSILKNPNQDPHEFTTDAATAKAVADADIVIYSGISYDPWMEQLLGTRGKADRAVINVSALIGAHDGDNPHIWYEPKTMPALAEKMVALLSTRDPARADFYHQRLAVFIASMQPNLATIARIKEKWAGTEVTATEPVFGYMARALGFNMLNEAFQIKIMNDTEPGADDTEAFEQSLSSDRAKILFYNSQVTDPTTDRMQKLARQAGIPVVGVTETEPPDQTTYSAWIKSELAAVEAALPTTNR